MSITRCDSVVIRRLLSRFRMGVSATLTHKYRFVNDNKPYRRVRFTLLSRHDDHGVVSTSTSKPETPRKATVVDTPITSSTYTWAFLFLTGDKTEKIVSTAETVNLTSLTEEESYIHLTIQNDSLTTISTTMFILQDVRKHQLVVLSIHVYILHLGLPQLNIFIQYKLMQPHAIILYINFKFITSGMIIHYLKKKQSIYLHSAGIKLRGRILLSIS